MPLPLPIRFRFWFPSVTQFPYHTIPYHSDFWFPIPMRNCPTADHCALERKACQLLCAKSINNMAGIDARSWGYRVYMVWLWAWDWEMLPWRAPNDATCIEWSCFLAPSIPNLIYIYVAWPPGKQLLRLASGCFRLQELCVCPRHTFRVFCLCGAHISTFPAQDMEPSFA